MKNLKQILELYKPKSQDEDKFVKKHIVVKHKDRNGNGDPLFQATNIKAVDRKAERHGYEPGQDEEVYEETLYEDDDVDDHTEKMKDIEDTYKPGGKHARSVPKGSKVGDAYSSYNSNAPAGLTHTVKIPIHHSDGSTTEHSHIYDPKTGKMGDHISSKTFDKKGRRVVGEDTAENAAWRRKQREIQKKATKIHGYSVTGKTGVYRVFELGSENPHGHKVGDEVPLKQVQKHEDDYDLIIPHLHREPYQRKKKVAEETEALEEKYYHTPGHLKKQLEDKYGPAHTTVVHADQDSGTIQYINRHLDPDGGDSYEIRVHQLVGSGPIKNRTIGKLIRHSGKKRSLKKEEIELFDEGILDTVKSKVSSIANRFKSKPKQENKPQAPARPTQTQTPARPEKKETNSEPSLKQHIHTAIHTNDPKEYDRAMSGISKHAEQAGKVGKYAGKVIPTKTELHKSIASARKHLASGGSDDGYAAAAIKHAHKAGQNIHHMIHGSAAGYMKEQYELYESGGFHKITIEPAEKNNPNGTHRAIGHKADGTKVNLTYKKSAEHKEDAERTAREHASEHGLTPDKSKPYGTFIKPMKEHVEYIEEKLKVSDGIGAWISDFVHSKNPKFDGFSKRKRMKMAQAAFYSAQRGD